ncbi:beta-N-acetylhexosaminidase [Caldalkalibacillus salinus]|uniref:beta-N-acetylhexosaminidase n=1 Tax=Caldalkalibacillus salinus TaxID=2803787 RepID=UPI001922ABBA|nr:beta-N-acetylhexosaminidase [Caldalkalibacillus salinus]
MTRFSLRNKQILWVLLAVFLIMFMAACSQTPSTDSEEPPVNEGDTVNPQDENDSDATELSLVPNLVQDMSLEEKIGQMFMPQIEMLDGAPTHRMNEKLEEMLDQQHVGGVILFSKNIESTEQLVTLTHDLQEHTSIPLFTAIDQEGGNVDRLPFGTNLPGNMALGASQTPRHAYEAGRVTGTELKALGINVNFAPVLDVNNNPRNPVIGVRSYGEDPNQVAVLGSKYIEGLHDAGVVATAKHFPGHGDTHVDSHVGLPELDKSADELENLEWFPFRHAIQSDLQMVMTAHMMFPQLDEQTVKSKLDGKDIHLPATLSETMLQHYLREQIGFDGIVVTDAFTMKAIADHFGETDAVLRAVKAGADIILMPRELEDSYEALLEAVQSGEISEARIDESVTRILALKQDMGLLTQVGEAEIDEQDTPTMTIHEKIEHAQQVVGATHHAEAIHEITQASATWVKHEKGINRWMLEDKPHDGDKVLVMMPSQHHLTRAQETWQVMQSAESALEGVDVTWRVYDANVASSLTNDNHSYDYYILMTHNLSLNEAGGPLVTSLNSLVNHWNMQDVPYVHIALELPYDAGYIPNVQRSLALYGSETVHYEVMFDVLFSGVEAKGVLPVELPQPEAE